MAHGHGSFVRSINQYLTNCNLQQTRPANDRRGASEASGARITHIKGGFAESQHGFGQNIEFTASRPRCYYLVQITDAGSVPCSATNTNAQLCMQLGIFLEVPRICAGSCGFLRTSPRRPDA